MKYRCLRACYVEDRLFAKGESYDLPDAFPKYEKNFELMGEPESTSPTSNLVCTECGRECKSELGLKSHMRTHQKKEKG